MNHINTFFVRALISSRMLVMKRNETGAVTAEYGTVALVAIALALAVLALFTSGKMDDLLHGLMSAVLKHATTMAK